jgi:hypothetical protein
MSSSSPFCGSWSFVSNENYNEFLTALGLNILERKAAQTVKPTLVISQNDQQQQWNIIWKTEGNSKEIVYNENVEYDEGIISSLQSISIQFYNEFLYF